MKTKEKNIHAQKASLKELLSQIPQNLSTQMIPQNLDILQEEDDSSSFNCALDFQSQIASAKIQSAMQIGQGPDERTEKGQLYQIADVQSGSTRGKCRIVFLRRNS